MGRPLLFLTILISFVLGLYLLGVTFITPSVTSAQDNQDHVPGQILVKFKAGTSQNVIDTQLKSHNARVVDRITALDVLVVNIPSSTENRVLTALSRNPNVEYAEFDYIATAVIAPSDSYFNNQWGLENTGQTINGVIGTVDADINAPTAWNTTLGVGVTAAILDSGINESHQDLVGKVVNEQDFTGSASGTNDVYGHGTHVAGIVAANTNNSIGVAGVCPNCVLLNGKVLNDSGSGAYSWIANGILWATNNGAKVINLSLGGPPSSKTLESAVNYAWNNGSVIVAAAGNCGCQAKLYPAAYTKVIAVAATDNQDNKASFSSYSAKWVDVAAPGAYIFSTWKNQTSAHNPQPVCSDPINPNSCYKFASGTSMATPMTSGTVALIWSTSWGTSASNVRSRLETKADKIIGTGNWWSAGRVNAANAVAP